MVYTSFEKIIILDWYDKIINGFIEIENKFYYCNLLFEGVTKYDCIYVHIPLNFFVYRAKIIQIIESNSFKENWGQLYHLLNRIQRKNKSYLVKTQDLKFGPWKIVKYKDNFDWDAGILFLDYPEILDRASKIDNWEQYFHNRLDVQSGSQLNNI